MPERDWKAPRYFLRDWVPMSMRRELSLARAQRLRLRVAREERRESLPGGLFGTYWKHGIEGRDEAREAAIRRWRDMEAEAERLDREGRP